MHSVCGLEIVSTQGVDVHRVSCQAFKDAAGTQPGSARFTFGNSANIATNPVQEKAIFCQIDHSPVTVTIKETPCIQESELEEYTIDVGYLVQQGSSPSSSFSHLPI
jgi:hypothetical protein